MTPYRPHGKSPMIETNFIFVIFVLSTSFIPLQLIQPSSSYVPFGTITVPPTKPSSVYETIMSPIPYVFVTLPISIPT